MYFMILANHIYVKTNVKNVISVYCYQEQINQVKDWVMMQVLVSIFLSDCSEHLYEGGINSLQLLNITTD